MSPSLVDLEMALVTQDGSEATTLGTTPSNIQQNLCSSLQNLQGHGGGCGNVIGHCPSISSSISSSSNNRAGERWQLLFHTLPTELHFSIMAHLFRDPVSQICFGLTSRYFHTIFHSTMDKRQYYTTPAQALDCSTQYQIKRYPFDLRMQAAVDESHVLFGWYEYGYMLGATCVKWQRSLGELLWEEKSLWGDLWFCEGCLKYKPENAFGGFALEERLHEENPKVFEMDCEEGEGWDPYWYRCRRCRARVLLIDCEGREEVVEVHGNAFEERESLGLVRIGEEGRSRELWMKMICNYDEDPNILELWDEVFAKMGI